MYPSLKEFTFKIIILSLVTFQIFSKINFFPYETAQKTFCNAQWTIKFLFDMRTIPGQHSFKEGGELIFLNKQNKNFCDENLYRLDLINLFIINS